MKKLIVILFAVIILLTGCENKEDNKEKDNLSVYEYHYYNKMAKSSNNYVAKYDEKGNFISLEITTIFDERSTCPNEFFKAEKYVDVTYPEVIATCSIVEGKQKLYYKMTNKSVENGYLKDENKDFLLGLQYVYPDVENEKKAEEYFNKGIEIMKSENIKEDAQNYIVIKNKKVHW